MTSSTRATDDRTESTNATTVSRRAAALSTRLAASSPLRPTAGGGLAVIIASAVVSLAGFAVLGETMRIRWSIGTYYGPEYASTTVVLTAVPLLVAVAVGAFRGVAVVLERADGFDDVGVRAAYELAALSVLLSLLLGQAALVVANLW